MAEIIGNIGFEETFKFETKYNKSRQMEDEIRTNFGGFGYEF